jgi:acetyl esterase/lipase
LIRSFLDHAAHHTVEELQAFTSQWVPHPRWVKVDPVTIPSAQIAKAADVLIAQLGHKGINQVGGSKWWQWRRKGADLKAEWIEMRGDYNIRKKNNDRGRRVMLYVHGGGYFFGSVDEHRYQLQRHARKLRARVFAPRYRLAPQFPFPCGLQDCLAAYLYLLTVQEPSDIILAGDSAGGGMVVSMLVILRDRGLPLPAGAVLISPWVDPTHSFPSVAKDSDFDYIPPHGFMQRPSPSWPPPNGDEIQAIAEGAVSQAAGHMLPRKSAQQERNSAEQEAVQGFAVCHLSADDEAAHDNPSHPADDSHPEPRAGNTIPGPGHQLKMELNGKLIVIKDQIQMYTTNRLLSHPLVAPVLQPTLGGLPPLLILTGGGEILRDEQIYLGHKAANPEKYLPGNAYLDEYDPDRTLVHKYKPTNVQLQVWEDLCHVAPTLSFTRPAKFMYRSVAQFGAWALARAQNTSIEIMDDDGVSVISSGSDTEAEIKSHPDKVSKLQVEESEAGMVGKAGDPLPVFRDHMIRQRVDRHGVIYPLAPAEELPAMQMPASDIGVIKPGPIRKWLEAKKEWDRRYAREKRKVQKQRIKEMAEGGSEGFGAGEQAPPSALAGRKKEYDMGEEKKKKSYGLMMWSMFGSKHDEHTIQREESAVQQEERDRRKPSFRKSFRTENGDAAMNQAAGETGAEANLSPSSIKDTSRSRGRRRTVTVTDAGQTEGWESGYHKAGLQAVESGSGTMHARNDSNMTTDSSMLSPRYNPPKFRNKNLDILKDDDRVSVSTGADIESLRNASTTAVFAAPGLLSRERKETNTSYLSASLTSEYEDGNVDGMRSEVASTMRPDTPLSNRSNERLQSHQDVDSDHLRSPSAVAILKAPGVVGVVNNDDGTEASTEEKLEEKAIDQRDTSESQARASSAEKVEAYLEAKVKEQENKRPDGSGKQERPGMHDRTDTEFQTAMEVL